MRGRGVEVEVEDDPKTGWEPRVLECLAQEQAELTDADQCASREEPRRSG